MSLERQAIEMDVRFLAELEEVIAAIVQQRNPVEGDLIEQRPSIEVGGKREQRVQERVALRSETDHRIRKHGEVRTDRSIQTEAACAVEEDGLVADRDHDRGRARCRRPRARRAPAECSSSSGGSKCTGVRITTYSVAARHDHAASSAAVRRKRAACRR